MTQTRKRATSNKRFGHKKNSGNLRLSVKKGMIKNVSKKRFKKKRKKSFKRWKHKGGDFRCPEDKKDNLENLEVLSYAGEKWFIESGRQEYDERLLDICNDKIIRKTKNRVQRHFYQISNKVLQTIILRKVDVEGQPIYFLDIYIPGGSSIDKYQIKNNRDVQCLVDKLDYLHNQRIIIFTNLSEMKSSDMKSQRQTENEQENQDDRLSPREKLMGQYKTTLELASNWLAHESDSGTPVLTSAENLNFSNALNSSSFILRPLFENYKKIKFNVDYKSLEEEYFDKIKEVYSQILKKCQTRDELKEELDEFNEELYKELDESKYLEFSPLINKYNQKIFEYTKQRYSDAITSDPRKEQFSYLTSQLINLENNIFQEDFDDTQLRELTDLKTQYKEKLCNLSINNGARSKYYCDPKEQSGVLEESV